MSDAKRRDRHRRLDRNRRGNLPANARARLRGRFARAPQGRPGRMRAARRRGRSDGWRGDRAGRGRVAVALRHHACRAQRRRDPAGAAADVKPEDLQALTQLHLGAALTLVQAALPAMKRSGFGRIVMMSSRGALGPADPDGLCGDQSRHDRHGPNLGAGACAADGITVNVVAPGPIADTEMFRERRSEDSEREKALAAAIPVKRLGRSDDVARAVMFFCDRANGFVTGLSVPKTKFVNNGGEGHRRPAPMRCGLLVFPAKPFCQGEPGAMGLSRMPMARNRRVTAAP